ncbi:MAG: tyrosine-type recombinase/integrase [Thiotrichales bacterium]|nr:tyrosine-type recombinase/integrase [Thiotrichales bacterium]
MTIDLTDACARDFSPPPGREAVLWDHTMRGLGLRVRPSGRRTWIVHRRIGREVVKRTLGEVESLTVEDARIAAQTLLDDIAAHRIVIVPRMRTFASTFLADGHPRWKPTTRVSHARNLDGLILPELGARRVDTLTARDVRGWFDALATTRPASANRALAVLSALMQHAEILGLRPQGSNPCQGLRRRTSRFRARYLSADELAALGRALDRVHAAYPTAVAALRFLLYTGARKSEALGLRWAYIHGDRAVLPDSKTGPRTLWLAPPARAVLASLPRRAACPWVFVGTRGAPVSLAKAWRTVCDTARLDGMRLHDCRHNFAAVAVSADEGLRTVSGLLGHADIKTTFGYAHLAEEEVRQAADRVSRVLACALDGPSDTARADRHNRAARPDPCARTG